MIQLAIIALAFALTGLVIGLLIAHVWYSAIIGAVAGLAIFIVCFVLLLSNMDIG